MTRTRRCPIHPLIRDIGGRCVRADHRSCLAKMKTTVSTSDWRPLRGVDHGRLSEARLQAHYAAQWLARAARAFIPPQPDDGHTNLGWDHAFGGFTTHR